MKKKILMPTDFSENAWQAMLYALDLFKDTACEFFILNAFKPTSYALESMMIPEPSEKYYEHCKKQSDEDLKEVLDLIEEQGIRPNHSFEAISQMGFLIDTIETVVKKRDIELIVMGTKGATGSRAPIFGTNTVYVMENVNKCPVLAIPEDCAYSPLKEIVFPTDFRLSFKGPQLQHLVSIAKIANTPVRFLHVTASDKLDKEQKENKKLLTENFADVEHSFHTLSSGKTATALSNFVESRESDMIAFVTRRPNFFKNLFSEPLVRELGYYSKVPILTLHDVRR